MRKSIALNRQAAPEAVLNVAEEILRANGYLWVPVSPTRAEAHEGGREITHTAFTRKLQLDLELRDGSLVLSNVTRGARLGALINNPVLSGQIRRQVRHSTRLVQTALDGAKLT